MLPSPFGSAPPASLASRSRAGARVRAGAVSSVLTNGLEHGCVPALGARLPIRRCQPVPQARTTETCRQRGGGACAATVQRYLPHVPAAAVPVDCCAALAPGRPRAALRTAQALGEKASREGGVPSATVGTQALARAAAGWGSAVRAAAKQQEAGVVEREAPAAGRESQARPRAGGPDVRAGVRASWPACPRYAAAGLAQAACALTEGVPLLPPLAGAAADKLGGPCGGRELRGGDGRGCTVAR